MRREGTAESRDSEKLDRIVQAAMSVFNRRGFHKATMQEVAEEAGVGKGTTYLYFASKDQLLEHIFALALDLYQQQISEATALPLSAPERLHRLLVTTLTTAQLNRGMSRFVLEGLTGLSVEFKNRLLRVRRGVLQDLSRLVEQGVDAGELRPVDPLVTAHVIFATASSVAAALLWEGAPLPAGGDDTPAERAEFLAEKVMSVLALAPPGARTPATAQ